MKPKVAILIDYCGFQKHITVSKFELTVVLPVLTPPTPSKAVVDVSPPIITKRTFCFYKKLSAEVAEYHEVV